MPKKTLKQKYSARLCSNPPKKMTAPQKKLFKKYCKSDSDSDSDSDFDYDEYEHLFEENSDENEGDENEEVPLDDSSYRGSEDISTYPQQNAQNTSYSLFTESSEVPLNNLIDFFDNTLLTEAEENFLYNLDESKPENTNTLTFQQQIAQNIINTEDEDKQIENLIRKDKYKIPESVNVDASESAQSEIQLHPTIVAIQEKSTPKKYSFLDSITNKLSPSKENAQQRRWKTIENKLNTLSQSKLNEIYNNVINSNATTNTYTFATKPSIVLYFSKHAELWPRLQTTLKNY